MTLENVLLADDVMESIKENKKFLFSLIPELKDEVGFKQNHPHHHLDVWNHTLLALSLSEKDYDVRLCLLLHDIGKPHSYQDEEIRHFRNHADVSEIMSNKILHRLGYKEKYINDMCYLIKNHDTKITDEQINNNLELTEKLFKIQKCDSLAHNPEMLVKRKQYLESTKQKLIRKRTDITNDMLAERDLLAMDVVNLGNQMSNITLYKRLTSLEDRELYLMYYKRIQRRSRKIMKLSEEIEINKKILGIKPKQKKKGLFKNKTL